MIKAACYKKNVLSRVRKFGYIYPSNRVGLSTQATGLAKFLGAKCFTLKVGLVTKDGHITKGLHQIWHQI